MFCSVSSFHFSLALVGLLGNWREKSVQTDHDSEGNSDFKELLIDDNREGMYRLEVSTFWTMQFYVQYQHPVPMQATLLPREVVVHCIYAGIQCFPTSGQVIYHLPS